MKKYKIFKVYHDRELLKTFPCPEDRTYYDTSLSEWGKYFCEGLIFFDDNLDIDAEYIGLEHYCRSFTNLNVNTADKYLSKVDNNFCWTWYHVLYSYFEDKIGYFSSKIFKWDELDLILFKYLKEKKLFKELIIATRADLLVHRTMFILTKDNFIKMRRFIRETTKYFLSELRVEKPSDINILVEGWKPELSIFRGTSRLFAFIIEHLAAIWITTNIANLEDFPDILENGNKEFRYDFTNLDIHLVDLCNLNCAYCSHLAPFADKFFLNPGKFEKDLASIPVFVRNKFKYIYLLGGEPLLHPLVCNIINIARKYFPNKDIRFLTNGILLPKMDLSFYDCIKKNNIFLDITLYPIKFDYSFINKLKDINILTHKVDNNRDFGFWKQQLDPKGLLDYNYLYRFCLNHRKKNCLLLDGTFLRCCPTEKHAHFLNNLLDINIRNFKEDCLDLSNVKDILEIEDWYYTPKKFCSQCINDKWEPKNYLISKKDIKEYV